MIHKITRMYIWLGSQFQPGIPSCPVVLESTEKAGISTKAYLVIQELKDIN